MANTVNYATQFERQLRQKYKRECLSDDLTTEKVKFVNAKTVKIPYITLGGFKDHGRDGGFNRQNAKNDFMTYTLAHDRDVEYFIDTEDVDESNLALSAANITNTFEEEHAIPERDCYNFSKIYSEYKTRLTGTVDNTALTTKNVLTQYDSYMKQMDEDEVPEEGRLLYVTPTVNDLIKNAEDVQKIFSINAPGNGFMRAVRSLDDVKIRKVPSVRMKTAYNYTDGCTPGVSAKQINMILVHPKSVISCDKHAYIKLWAPGSHTQGDGYLYQLRKYWDLFLIDTRMQGVKINAEAESTEPEEEEGGGV